MYNQTMLCISTRRWHSLWRESQQIMSRLARHNRVLFFEPGRDPDRSQASELARNAPHFVRMPVEEVQANVFVIPTPAWLPYARKTMPATALRVTAPLIAKYNAAATAVQVRRAMRYFNVVDPILWVYDPRHIDLVGQFGEQLSCYHNYDEMAGFAGNERLRQFLDTYDERLCKKVDLVFATSRGQVNRRRNYNPETYLLPNGVNYELFNQALDPATPVPADIAALPKPVIGLVGWLSFQVDPLLLLRIAEAYPDCSLALVGPDAFTQDATYQQLKARPNVHFLGRKPVEELPRYLKAIDVATIPYRVEGHNLTAYPLKLHEYLAAGRPVVATALPELRHFTHVVRVAATYDEFLAELGEALQERDQHALATRLAEAQQNTWDKRVEEIYRVFNARGIAAAASQPATTLLEQQLPG